MPRISRTVVENAINGWYNAKDKELLDKRGELHVTERNLSSAARAYHEGDMEDHARTRGTLETSEGIHQ